jgi:hypothetical protein
MYPKTTGFGRFVFFERFAAPSGAGVSRASGSGLVVCAEPVRRT